MAVVVHYGRCAGDGRERSYRAARSYQGPTKCFERPPFHVGSGRPQNTKVPIFGVSFDNDEDDDDNDDHGEANLLLK